MQVLSNRKLDKIRFCSADECSLIKNSCQCYVGSCFSADNSRERSRFGLVTHMLKYYSKFQGYK